MTVKEKRGRRRYVAFAVPEGLAKHELIGMLVRHGNPYVVQCGLGFAVLRCAPSETEHTTEAMASLGFASLMTSGTLKALRSKVHGLEDATRSLRGKG